MDELRNRAIYELNREVVDDAVDSQDDTLPYIESDGSALDHVVLQAEAALGAIDYILETKSEWNVIDDPEAP